MVPQRNKLILFRKFHRRYFSISISMPFSIRSHKHISLIPTVRKKNSHFGIYPLFSDSCLPQNAQGHHHKFSTRLDKNITSGIPMFYPHSNPRTIALGRFYPPATITPPTRTDRKAEVSNLNLQTPDAGQKKSLT